MSETIETETPTPPTWVVSWQARKAWKENLEWRCNAAEVDTESKAPIFQRTRYLLLKRAIIMYGE